MRQWYYATDGNSEGPVPEDRLVAMFRSGEVPPDTLVWTDGMQEWAAGGGLETFSAGNGVLPQGSSAADSPSGARGTGAGSSLYLHIPIGRLVFLGILSLGLYEAYWIYRTWRYVKERDGLAIRPFWRGIFGIFFLPGILKRIREDPQANRLEKATFSAGGLAVGWIMLVLLGNLLGRTEETGMNLLGLLISLPSFLFFLPVQEYLNRVNAKLDPAPDYLPWTTGHWVCAGFGILSWLMVLGGVSA